MSVQPEDRITIDMFAPRGPGRPRSNPYDRSLQCRVNKRSQRRRDKARGLKRVEVKLPDHVIEHLDAACEQLNLNRAEVIELSLRHWLHLGED
ncbi:LexA regulated protein [Bacterioplanes sanyensis]|uniref:LexA regulated protein n=1 Tax=Bacterioplanes sanyensis TaxID=1249553 RepID=A0A222FMT7_9GAMM|nr:LexA regulated protein [Bacterioplanes sanyensis]ASP39691.1 LexA regulated protein [Bacterioplanes sanyensis]